MLSSRGVRKNQGMSEAGPASNTPTWNVLASRAAVERSFDPISILTKVLGERALSRLRCAARVNPEPAAFDGHQVKNSCARWPVIAAAGVRAGQGIWRVMRKV